MVFNSVSFIVFFALVLAGYHLPISWAARKGLLVGASYLFYGAWNPAFVGLLVLSTAVDYTVGGAMPHATAMRRFWFLQVSLVTNLGLLAVFKYSFFLQSSVAAVLVPLGVNFEPKALDVALPVGISFYTFQTLSYTLDVYRGRLKPASSLLDFSLFVAFFPQLVAGPIVRASDFLPQLERPRRATSRGFAWGCILLTGGLFAKVVLADTLLAPVVETVFGSARPVGPADAWIGALAFAGQIYFDFAGYSTCAVGVALCLGFALPDNFMRPYGARGFSDFWRRWHISLSSWLRDYLYISLGGNRRGPNATQRNLMITMLLGGLWHGASWTFVAWGALHGLFLIVERRWGGLLRRLSLPAWIGAAGTFLCVCVTWVFFRADSFAQAGFLLLAMAGGFGDAAACVGNTERVLVLSIVGALWLQHNVTRDQTTEQLARRLPRPLLLLGLVGMVVSILLSGGSHRAFIYFQF